MGLLDDAIREHLELKRRRGADAGDISRQESEALGPVRRFPDGAPDMPDTFEPPHDDVAAPLTEVEPWEGEETAIHPAPPARDFEPPSSAAAPPPPAAGYELPVAPPSAYEPPSPSPPRAPEPSFDLDLDPEPEPPPPPPASSEPAWRAYSPDPEPAPPTYTREPDPEFRHAPDPEPEADDDPWSLGPDPDPVPGKPADAPSRFSRLRIGRRGGKSDPEQPPSLAEPSPAVHDDYEPPPLPRTTAPSSFEPSSPYEPPPAPPSGYDYNPPTAPHEPDIVPADDEGEAEDVLEETPDFLEETPEHDRLWFEQRPPRDFNFDD